MFKMSKKYVFAKKLQVSMDKFDLHVNNLSFKAMRCHLRFNPFSDSL